MRKSMAYVLFLTALMIGLIFFLSSDFFPDKEGELVDEQEIDESKPATEQEIITSPEITDHPETIVAEVGINGQQEEIELTRYSDEGNTYVIYMDESSFEFEDGLSQTITAKDSSLVTLTIESIPDQLPEQVARTRAEQFRQDFSINGPQDVTDPIDGLYLKGSSDAEDLHVYITLNPMEDTVFIVTARYPSAQAEGLGARIDAMINTFVIEDTRDVQ
ncbi:hypothetical protein MKY84_02865 [Chryseomicrobium sp. FSL W7-1435]|uniref:hypothetical protein n=1 Tax=Chryseomicrobium sp. FSL W7-1435 TaxID=2921704 RepID=UPI00315AE68A